MTQVMAGFGGGLKTIGGGSGTLLFEKNVVEKIVTVKARKTNKRMWQKINHWFCKIGLCNLDKCKCACHQKKCCRDLDCKCKS